MTRSEAIAANIARKIARNRTRKHWATLHADALEETKHMSTPTSSTLNGGSTMAPEQDNAMPNAAAEGRKASPANNATGSGVTSGMAVGSQVVVGAVKPVDSKTLGGSYPGDHRAKAAPAVLPNNPGPREAVGQAPLSGKQAASSKPESFLGAEGSDQN